MYLIAIQAYKTLAKAYFLILLKFFAKTAQ